MTKPVTHLVGFKTTGQLWLAKQIFRGPYFIHPGNDTRMRRELAEGDTVVFANGTEAKVSDKTFHDFFEPDDPAVAEQGRHNKTRLNRG